MGSGEDQVGTKEGYVPELRLLNDRQLGLRGAIERWVTIMGA